MLLVYQYNVNYLIHFINLRLIHGQIIYQDITGVTCTLKIGSESNTVKDLGK